jgi:YD repeat-containing protein
MIDENENITNITYDGLGQVIDVTTPEGGRVELLYDAIGNEIKRKDELGYVTTSEYTNGNYLTKTISPKGAETKTEYDLEGNVIKITDPLR